MTPVDRVVYGATGLVLVMLLIAIVSGMLATLPAIQEMIGR